jgi:hypothetical protein
VQWGKSIVDVGYFIGGALSTEDRREHEERLVRIYHDTLTANGVTDFTWEDCWDQYRRQVFWGIAMVVAPSMFVEQTERGDDMFMTWLERACQQAIDLGSVELLPEDTGVSTPLRPTSKDESPHEPGPELLWSESWYLDAISDDGTLSVYSRIGDTENLGRSLYMMAIVRPGQPPIMISDDHAPLPTREFANQSIKAEQYTMTQEIQRPMVDVRTVFDGTARQYSSETSMFHGDAGEPVAVSFDLTWHTNGIPYQWRPAFADRYEVPCRVAGTVVIDGVSTEFSGVGQRDHSWGERDWWAKNWMWCAFHLNDGTRMHAVVVDDHGLAFGYVQLGDELTELSTGRSRVERDDPDIVTRCVIELDGVDLQLEVIPQAHASVLLVNEDDRRCHFLRALANVTTADGRSGNGWIEWGFNKPESSQSS